MTMPLTILVDEDETLVMIDIVDQLKLVGYRVVEAFNADEAIAILEADPDSRLLCTDVDMPGSMDGVKMAAAVRDRWPPVRIIVTSGHRTVEALDIPQERLFFGKPYRPSDVIVSVQRLRDSTALQTGRGTHSLSSAHPKNHADPGRDSHCQCAPEGDANGAFGHACAAC